jgi:hypothetical protein
MDVSRRLRSGRRRFSSPREFVGRRRSHVRQALLSQAAEHLTGHLFRDLCDQGRVQVVGRIGLLEGILNGLDDGRLARLLPR